MKLNKGDKAPEIKLRDTNGDWINSKDLNKDSKLLVIFFPFAFSGTCTKEVCTLRDNMKLYNAFNTKVIGISVDSYFTLKEFKKVNNLNFLLLSDFNREIIEAYNVNFTLKGMKQIPRRAAFIISAEGTVQYSEIMEDANQGLNFKQIQNQLG